MTNPNVPADQKAAAETSAPDAKVTSTQPAQLPTGTPTQVSTPVAQPLSPVSPAAAPMTGTPARAAAPTATPAGANMADTRKSEIDKEQATLKSLNSETEGMDYFEQQEAFAKVFEEREGEDSFRRAARYEREREAFMSKGDPTRDPVAKQAAMDKNTVAPGALEDAKKIRDIGEEKLREDSENKGLTK